MPDDEDQVHTPPDTLRDGQGAQRCFCPGTCRCPRGEDEKENDAPLDPAA